MTAFTRDLDPNVQTFGSIEFSKLLPENYAGANNGVLGGANSQNAAVKGSVATLDFDPDGDMINKGWGGENLEAGVTKTVALFKFRGSDLFLRGKAVTTDMAAGFKIDKIYIKYKEYNDQTNLNEEKELLLGLNLTNANYDFSELDFHFKQGPTKSREYIVFADMTAATVPVAGERLMVQMLTLTAL